MVFEAVTVVDPVRAEGRIAETVPGLPRFTTAGLLSVLGGLLILGAGGAAILVANPLFLAAPSQTCRRSCRSP